MNLRMLVSVLLVSMVLSFGVPLSEGNSSGKHNSGSSGCSCHGSASSSITLTNDFPTQYTPSQTYTINIGFTGGNGGSGGGFSLQANKGTLTNAGSNMQISGTSATHSGSAGTSWTFQWRAPSQGSGDVTVNYVVMNANRASGNNGDVWSQSTFTISEAAPVNNPPSVSNLAISPNGDIMESESFTLTYTYQDPDGDQEGPTQIRWFVDGTLSTAHNDRTTIQGVDTSLNQVWTAEVTPSDGTDFGATRQCLDEVRISIPDSDGDGVQDSQDAFPNDPTESADSDSDGVGDNSDAFPNDPTETADSDSDGVGDNSDVFPNDSTETTDSDGDGVGDNADAFPNDPTGTSD